MFRTSDADDNVIFAHAKKYQEIASTLTAAMAHIDVWLTKSCLYLNTKQQQQQQNSLYGIYKTKYEGVTF